MDTKNSNSGIRLAVKITPNARRNEITGFKNGILQIKVAAPPEKGKANKAVMNLLAEKLGIRKSLITIIKGETSRNKIIFIDGINREGLVKLQKPD